MKVVSMKGPVSGKADVQISNTVRCYWHTWPTRLPHFVVRDYIICGYVKSELLETRPANINDLKQRNHEDIQGIPREML
jgi:hypothetical protein